MVGASDKLDIAVTQEAHQITGLVQTGLRARRLNGSGHESIGRQFGLVEIAVRKARAAQIEFAGNPDGNRVQVPIQNVKLGIGKRPADGNARGSLRDFGHPVPGGERWCSR